MAVETYRHIGAFVPPITEQDTSQYDYGHYWGKHKNSHPRLWEIVQVVSPHTSLYFGPIPKDDKLVKFLGRERLTPLNEMLSHGWEFRPVPPPGIDNWEKEAATDPQKRLAKDLGICFAPNITKAAMSQVIHSAIQNEKASLVAMLKAKQEKPRPMVTVRINRAIGGEERTEFRPANPPPKQPLAKTN